MHKIYIVQFEIDVLLMFIPFPLLSFNQIFFRVLIILLVLFERNTTIHA